jgi:hypothetical protein
METESTSAHVHNASENDLVDLRANDPVLSMPAQTAGLPSPTFSTHVPISDEDAIRTVEPLLTSIPATPLSAAGTGLSYAFTTPGIPSAQVILPIIANTTQGPAPILSPLAPVSVPSLTPMTNNTSTANQGQVLVLLSVNIANCDLSLDTTHQIQQLSSMMRSIQDQLDLLVASHSSNSHLASSTSPTLVTSHPASSTFALSLEDLYAHQPPVNTTLSYPDQIGLPLNIEQK